MHKSLIMSALCMALAACGGSNDSNANQPLPAEDAISPTPAEPDVEPPTQTAEAEPAMTPTPVEKPAVDPDIVAKLASLPAPYNEADFAKGQRTFKQCATCHLLEKDAGNRVGPNLHNILDRESGHVESFNYSKAMHDSGLTWTYENLDGYLTNPRAFIPGNRMSFAGLRKPEDRHNVIAYLVIASGSLDAE